MIVSSWLQIHGVLITEPSVAMSAKGLGVQSDPLVLNQPPAHCDQGAYLRGLDYELVKAK
jgi:hypothetical protein